MDYIYTADTAQSKPQHMEYVMDVKQGVTAPTKQDLETCAKKIVATQGDGFQWSDIPAIMKIAFHFVDSYPARTLSQKQADIITIINYVIDYTDTPGLPDFITDPIFKALIPPFVPLVFPEALIGSIPVKVPDEMVQMKDEKGMAKLIATQTKGKMEYKDLMPSVRLSAQMAQMLPGLTSKEQTKAAKRIIDLVIDETDTPWLPDFWSDPIFKTFGHAMIDLLMD